MKTCCHGNYYCTKGMHAGSTLGASCTCQPQQLLWFHPQAKLMRSQHKVSYFLSKEKHTVIHIRYSYYKLYYTREDGQTITSPTIQSYFIS